MGWEWLFAWIKDPSANGSNDLALRYLVLNV